ncbi:MAG: MiaB/RimO family radical SAM methylthiotransferase [Mycoplasmataceae bacterium]|jgi:threonylcarbamoyladenosine tRNA methylthiotransferase MtaB|nr:MiaB/RimO family radical SAM methylthiotransferase [Mycoplasmataceae bacterium]
MEVKNKKFITFSLGCRVNICETNDIIVEGEKENMVYTKDVNEASIAIINTCCVTNKASSKSIHLIQRIAKLKNIEAICVCGCFSQLTQDIDIDKVKIIIGTKYKTKIIELLKKYEKERIILIDDLMKEKKFELSHKHQNVKNTRFFFKIQEGCNYNCSYCIIPLVRGRQRSCKKEEIFSTINEMIKNEIKEIVLTGVNLAGYNDNGYEFFDLLKDIKKEYEKEDVRFRLSSLEPFQINKEIIKFILANPIFCPSLHICLQSANDTILKDMERKYTFPQFLSLCNYARKINKLVSLTTDYIINFPSETKLLFDDSIKNLKKIKFSSMHIFPFSLHKQTKAALIKNLVLPRQKIERYGIISSLNEKFKNEYLKKFINKKVEVIFEQNKEQNNSIGHSQYFFSVIVKGKEILKNCKKIVKIVEVNNENEVFGVIA